jgi:UDP-GlcNAc:undecaprenyl-phosphate/decaprenyl-phosphate GlcNAc-1-phosphate transferase
MKTLFPFIGSATIYIIIAITWLELFKKRKILDKPGPDVPARPRVPNIQGIFLVAWFLITTRIFFPEYYNNHAFLWLAIGGGGIMLISLIDTILEAYFHSGIKAKYRLVFQVLSALIALGIWGVWFTEIIGGDGIVRILPWALAIWITILWFVGFMNAINRFDGIHSLASGVSTIWFVTIYALLQYVVLPYYSDIILPNTLATLTMTTNISFLLTIWSLIYTMIEYKPLWLVRDAGIMFYGFALAYLALMWGAKIWTLLVVLSLPLFDALRVFINRIFVMRKSPLKGDYSHLHYRLMAMGWNRGEVRWFIRWRSIFFMVIMIMQDTNRMHKIIIFAMMALIFFGTNIYLFWVKKLPMEYTIKK